MRPTFRGWDDAANRNRLLAAAREVDPEWIMFLDADERLAPDDALALRTFLENEADPDAGYFFRVHRMVGDLAHYDRARLSVGRLFAYRPGLRLPDARLHAVTLPTSIPRSRWRRTTLRIQHLAGLTEADRRARVQKYREADPKQAYHPDYDRLLAPTTRVREWWPRPAHLPVLANAPVPDAPAAGDDACPALSVVVIAQDDEGTIEQALRAVVNQECSEPFEVIVVTSGTDRTAEIVRTRFPDVRLVELDRPVLPGEARNAGLRVARGRYISFPGSHVQIRPGSVAARLRAHRRGYTMVTGTMLNGTRTPAGWASYFLDNTTVLPGRPSQALESAPARCSYLREALDFVGGFREDRRTAEDTAVNLELFERGYSAYRDRDIELVHSSPCRTVAVLVRHHFVRGRGAGRALIESNRDRSGGTGRIARFALIGALDRLRRMTRHVRMWGDGLRGRYWRSFPLIVLGAACWWLGACAELARGAPELRSRSRYQPTSAAARAAASHGSAASSRQRSPSA
jgi:glycosyltransferase involved in cell wall biosynthesis